MRRMPLKNEVVLGIDIGGTNTVFGFVDKSGKTIAESSVPTRPKESAEMLFERLFCEAKIVYSAIECEYTLAGIGIGAPNANYYKGTVELPPNLNWGVVNILDIVKKYYDLPSAITNDANAAAIGEMLFGGAKGLKDFIVITLGTGLGSGIVVNGELVYGHDGFAGELGHVVVVENGRQCGCGRKGCLETYASASGICRTVFEILCNSNAPSELRNVRYAELTAKAVYEAAKRGDAAAIEAFEATGEILGKSLANFITFSSPEAIVLFGGLAAAGELILEPTKKHLDASIHNIFRNKARLILSNPENGNAAILGSAALIWNEIEKMKK